MRNPKEAVVTNSASGRTTLISPGTTVRGDITFTGHLDIEGEVNGSIQAEPGQDAILRVVEGGKVAGEVKVPHAMINGKVEGDIHATERLELAEVLNIQTRHLVKGAKDAGALVQESK